MQEEQSRLAELEVGRSTSASMPHRLSLDHGLSLSLDMNLDTGNERRSLDSRREDVFEPLMPTSNSGLPRDAAALEVEFTRMLDKELFKITTFCSDKQNEMRKQLEGLELLARNIETTQMYRPVRIADFDLFL